MQNDNYYEILHIPYNATEEQIKSAYLLLIKQYHPDVYSGDKEYAEKMCSQINVAYSVLQDKTKREKYDTTHNIEKLRNKKCRRKFKNIKIRKEKNKKTANQNNTKTSDNLDKNNLKTENNKNEKILKKPIFSKKIEKNREKTVKNRDFSQKINKKEKFTKEFKEKLYLDILIVFLIVVLIISVFYLYYN